MRRVSLAATLLAMVVAALTVWVNGSLWWVLELPLVWLVFFWELKDIRAKTYVIPSGKDHADD